LLKGHSGASTPRIFLGAFGKHPGWNDHIDDQGLATPAMVALKQMLYVEGITASIPRWDALEPAQRLDEFGHLLLWRTSAGGGNGSPTQTLIARLWSSADGKGRSKYPMVALVHGSGVSLEFLFRVGVPELEAIEARCRATTSSAQVVSALDASRTALHDRLASEPEAGAEQPVPPSFLADLAAREQLGPDRQGLIRVLYQLQREVGEALADGPMGPGPARAPAHEQAHHFRVPALGDQAASLRDWSTLLLSMLGEREPMLLAAPASSPWVDIVLGLPGAGDVFCLRAGESIMPRVSDIPYTIEPEFVQGVDAWLSRRAAGSAQAVGAAARRSGRLAAFALAAGLAAASHHPQALAQTPDDPAATSPASAPADPARDAIALGSGGVTSSSALAIAWRRALPQLLAIHDAGEPARAAELAGKVRELLGKIDAGIPKGLDTADLPPSEWLSALSEAAGTRRERILRQMVDAWKGNTPGPADPLVEQQIVDAATAHAQWLARAETMASQLARLERDLSLAFPLDQPTPAGTLRQIAERWESDVIMTDPMVRDAARPPLERASKLAAVERSTDVLALVNTILFSEPPAPVELRLAAWRRLASVRAGGGGAAWPATPDELKTEVAFKAPLTLAIESIPDPARRSALLGELSVQQRERFERTISASTDAPAVAAAIQQAPQLGVTQDLLSPRVKFNLALVELKRLVADPATTDAQARTGAENFLAQARALPGGISFLADAQAVLVPLSGILSGKVVQPASPIPPDLGPAGTGLWRSVVQGDVARFTPIHRGLPELAFVMVPADGQSRDVTFVSTTEISVGAFASIVAELSSRKQLEQVLPRFDPLTDPRRGVRTWEWSGTVDGIPAIVPAADWLPRDPTVSREVYAPGLTPPAPTRDLPMDQLSPAAALFAARLVNCRLPTPGEWQRAATTYAARAPEPNLRDQTFARQFAFLNEARLAGAKVAGITDAVFHPAGVPGAGDAQAARDFDDQTLFFRPVAPSSPAQMPGQPVEVRDLVGNVAEWVVLPTPGDLPMARPQAVLAYFGPRQDAVRVIGGSALSSPGLDPSVPQPVSYADALEGYADVGFRLAFTVPGAVAGTGMGVAAQIDRLLTPTPMLPPK